jgi:hypothetical protein
LDEIMIYAPRLKKPTTINFNDRIRLKLNDLGWTLHRKWHDDLFSRACPNPAQREQLFTYHKPKVGDDGCVEFHLWEVAQIFGAHHNGCTPPFELSGVLVPAT